MIAEVESLQEQNELRQAKASLAEARQYQLEKAKRGNTGPRKGHSLILENVGLRGHQEELVRR
ncbi:hypothetical protein J5289_20630 [Rhizobium sp. B230/85]|nr:hypothetical protein [Rhizobium sp. B209b/85]QXZ81484.1 hypothetical protein J5274_24115 [Rhizobium sp. L51/94]QXZ99145.1 hypothetical protein J5289_20630 [Rhizobium sp. B230/85]